MGEPIICASYRRDYASLKRTKQRTSLPNNPHTAKRILAKGPVLVLSLDLSKKIGKSAALFLQQLHYWLQRGQGVEINECTFIYNTLDGWFDSLGGLLSISTLQRAIKKLVEENILIVRQFGGCHRINYYAINYEALEAFTPCNTSEINTSSHSVKMTSSSGQNDVVYIKNTKITNIKTNKSDAAPNALNDEIIVLGKKDITSPEVRGGVSQNAMDSSRDDKPQSLPVITNQVAPKQILGEDKSAKTNSQSSTTAAELLAIWNETVGKITHRAAITRERARFLIRAFRDKFNNSISAWRSFCESLTSSDFLMGRVANGDRAPFKASIDWVLKFSNLQKIFEGAYGVNQGAANTNDDAKTVKTLTVDDYITHINTSTTSEFDAAMHHAVLRKLIDEGALDRFHNSFYLTKVTFNQNAYGDCQFTTSGYTPFYDEVYGSMFKAINRTLDKRRAIAA